MSTWMRKTHRWLAVIFTVTVIVTFIALAQPDPMVWISYTPLPPLALMLITGLYMFAQPYLAKRRKVSGAVPWR